MATRTSQDLSPAARTRMQELGSAWIFKRAIQDNQQFKKVEDIKTGNPKDNGKTFNEIKKIWKTVGGVEWDDEVDKKWLENFYQQQKELIRKIGRPNFTLFTRDGKSSEAAEFAWQKENGETFMEWVSKLVNKEFAIGTKDNWNPADIWLIQNEKHWKDEIEKIWGKRKTVSKLPVEAELARFNSIFRALFRSRQIVGISLKKVSGGATWKEVNVSGKFFKNLKATKMKLTSAKCELGTVKIKEKTIRDAVARGKKNPRTGSTKNPLGKAGAATITQDTILEIYDPGVGPEAKPTTYKVQIKANNSTGFSNLKWEPTITSKTGARLGKATVELVLDLMKAYGMMAQYEPDNKKFPQDQTSFRDVQDEYRDIIEELLDDKFVDLGVKDATTALINISETFDIHRGQPWVASSKLQQLRFLYALMTVKGDKPKRINDFCTSLIFTAEKAGKRYGPYGKIY